MLLVSALATLVLYAGLLLRHGPMNAQSKLRDMPWWVYALAGLLHLSVAYQSGLGFFASLSWVTALMVLLASFLAWRKEIFLPSVSVLIATIALSALLIMGPGSAREASWQIQLHAAIALLSYALLSLAALQALLLILSERWLKTRDWTWLSALPPLSRLERHLFTLIWTGFAGLTLTLVSGGLFISDWMAQHLVHKTVLTIAAWLVFFALLLARVRFGLRGSQAAVWTLAGMSLLLLAFFGSKLVLEFILQRR
jgi:ABC-type uncharacterized transport system permease subunit